MDALVFALTGTRTELWFGHGCSGEPMLVTRRLIRVLEVFVSILGETWGRKAKPYTGRPPTTAELSWLSPEVKRFRSPRAKLPIKMTPQRELEDLGV